MAIIPGMMTRAGISIFGRVQGVFFRAFVKQHADKLGIKGCVQNKNDFVEVIAEGPKEKLDRLVELCAQGPDLADVDLVDNVEEEESKDFRDFRII